MAEQIHKRLSVEFVDEVTEAFNEQRVTERAVCELLGIKRSRLYEIRKKWLRCKRRREVFRLWDRSRSDFHKFPEEIEEWLHEELQYIRNGADLYRGRFNFAFLGERAEKEFGHPFQRNSLRRFAFRHGYYSALPEEKSKVYIRFETSGPGVLFQHDSSHHLWLPLTGERNALLLTEDDYSRKVLGGRIVEVETTWEHFVLTRGIVERYGRPLAYYVDNHSIFRHVGYTSRHYKYLKGPDEGEIQFKRALESLGIGLIYTGKGEAQAKGKIEKRFDYFQRRLPFLCEKHKVTESEEAQPILDDLIHYYNDCRVHQETEEIPSKRWENAIKEGKGKIKPLGDSVDLDRIFSLHDTRCVRKDGTITVRGKEYRVGRYAGQEVTLCLIPNAKLMAYKGQEKLCEYHL
jgi:transposase InsO family protein